MLRALLTLLVLTGCITGRQAMHASQPMPVVVAAVLDYPDRSNVGPVPPAVLSSLNSALEARNLVPKPLPFDSYANDFGTKKITVARLSDLAAKANGAQTIALLETKVVFYSELTGKFRWTVYAKTTIANVNRLNEAISSETTFPMFMDFDHEREDAVLTAAAPAFGDQIAKVADDFLSATTPTAPKTAATERKPIGAADSIYFVMVDRFENGDPTNDREVDKNDPEAFHGGDLQGVINRLDYIQNLGFTTVWLSPVFKMRTAKLNGHGAFHGYWVEDFTKVEPRFGTEETLVKLSNELHRRGMKLVLDVVLNHVGYDTPLVTQHPEWFHHNGDIKDWNDRKQLESYDVHGLPDLAQEREDVYQYLLSTSLTWIDRVHPDGFRLDAVKHVPLAFWARYNDDIRKHAGQDFFLLGEDLDGDPERLGKTLKEGKFTSVFDFPLHFAMVDVFCKGEPSPKLGARLAQDREYERPELLATLLDNHDLARIASACDGKNALVREALGFLLLSRGIPTLMYGTEFGLAGAKEPLNRADMPTGTPALGTEIAELLQFRHAHANLIRQATFFTSTGENSLASIRTDGTQALLLNVIGQWTRGNQDEVSAAAEADLNVLSRQFDLPETQAEGRSIYESNDPQLGEVDAVPNSVVAKLFEASSAKPLEAFKRLQQKTQKLTVFAEDVPLQAGDQLFLVGAGRQLGNWQPASAKGPFVREPQTKPTVTPSKRLVLNFDASAADVLEFKLLIRKSSGEYQWESTSNRYWFATDIGAPNCHWNEDGPCNVIVGEGLGFNASLN